MARNRRGHVARGSTRAVAADRALCPGLLNFSRFHQIERPDGCRNIGRRLEQVAALEAVSVREQGPAGRRALPVAAAIRSAFSFVSRTLPLSDSLAGGGLHLPGLPDPCLPVPAPPWPPPVALACPRSRPATPRTRQFRLCVGTSPPPILRSPCFHTRPAGFEGPSDRASAASGDASAQQLPRASTMTAVCMDGGSLPNTHHGRGAILGRPSSLRASTAPFRPL